MSKVNKMFDRSAHQQRIDAFMLQARQELPPTPKIPGVEVRKLRARLILEEAIETIEALGFKIVHDDAGYDVEKTHGNDLDLAEIVDGLCDLSVVTIGSFTACGCPDKPFLRLVDNNNLAKFRPGHSLREDGKLVKPPDHEPPDIRGLLDLMADWDSLGLL